jgi:hypothetical protein
MKYLIIFSLIASHIAVLKAPDIYHAAHGKVVDYVFAWATDQKLGFVDGAYTEYDAKQVENIVREFVLEKVEGIN